MVVTPAIAAEWLVKNRRNMPVRIHRPVIHGLRLRRTKRGTVPRGRGWLRDCPLFVPSLFGNGRKPLGQATVSPPPNRNRPSPGFSPNPRPLVYSTLPLSHYPGSSMQAGQGENDDAGAARQGGRIGGLGARSRSAGSPVRAARPGTRLRGCRPVLAFGVSLPAEGAGDRSSTDRGPSR